MMRVPFKLTGRPLHRSQRVIGRAGRGSADRARIHDCAILTRRAQMNNTIRIVFKTRAFVILDDLSVSTSRDRLD
jgi:hypothetical protein